MRHHFLLAPFLLLACAPATAPRPTGANADLGPLQLIDWRATNSVGTAGATLFGIVRSTTSDTLLEISSEIADRATLHLTSEAGRMEPAGALAIDAGTALTLRDRGAHAMLESLTQPLEPGDSLTVRLRFARAGSIELRVPVFRLTEASAELP